MLYHGVRSYHIYMGHYMYACMLFTEKRNHLYTMHTIAQMHEVIGDRGRSSRHIVLREKEHLHNIYGTVYLDNRNKKRNKENKDSAKTLFAGRRLT